MAKRPQPAKSNVPKFVNGRGTIPIKRTYKGLGQIRIPSDTTDEKTYRAIIDTLDNLYNVGNLTTLERIKNRELAPLDMLRRVRDGGFRKELGPDQGQRLVPSVKKWLETREVKDVTRKGYASHLAGFYDFCAVTDTVSVQVW